MSSLLISIRASALFRLAPAVIGQPKNRLDPGESPPAMTACQSPEPLRHARVQPLQASSVGVSEGVSEKADSHTHRLLVEHHRREGTAVPVMALHEVEHRRAGPSIRRRSLPFRTGQRPARTSPPLARAHPHSPRRGREEDAFLHHLPKEDLHLVIQRHRRSHERINSIASNAVETAPFALMTGWIAE